MYVIFGNGGDNTAALIQWAYEQKLTNVYVINIDTGWAHELWYQRIAAVKALAVNYGMNARTLVSKLTFPQLILDRQQFPSKKFQWCVSFLKALPLLTWLDEIDPTAQAIILLGSRRADSRIRLNLAYTIESSEFYGGRKVCYPLCDYNDSQRDELIHRSGLAKLNHRSLECEPCIYSTCSEISKLSLQKITIIKDIENTINSSFFNPADFNGASGIEDIVQIANHDNQIEKGLEVFDLGCGSHYVCGE